MKNTVRCENKWDAVFVYKDGVIGRSLGYVKHRSHLGILHKFAKKNDKNSVCFRLVFNTPGKGFCTTI